MDVSQDLLEALASDLGQHLLARGMMLACAESCTGGWAAQVCTAVSGSSAWFERGFVTYSNAAKMGLLGVPEAHLVSFGAVSLEVAQAMAAGTLAHSRAQVAFAITGIAGPTGGTAEKPVGTVCFAWAKQGPNLGQETRVSRMQFTGDRRAIRAQSVAYALAGMRDFMA